MKHTVDLSKYKIRTDLAVDLLNNKILNGIETEKDKYKDIVITKVKISDEGTKYINKKPGNYITIEFSDITDTDNYNDVLHVFAKELTKLLKEIGINYDDMCLVIGLGNDKSTPDSLGPQVINNVIVTNHLYLLNELDNRYRRVCTFNPGVMGQTGIETSDSIKSIVKTASPDFIIVIDALASQSLDRLNKTIQITDSGIEPGSGVGNSRKEVSKSVLGIPVIAIGVPTVVDAVTIVSDTISCMYKHYSYTKSNINNPLNKLLIKEPNYLNKKIRDDTDKSMIFGVVGSLNEEETKQLIYEVLSPIGYNLMVTPKEVDFVVNKLSSLISEGINQTLHKKC